MMAHRCSINVGRNKEVGDKHPININPWSPQEKKNLKKLQMLSETMSK